MVNLATQVHSATYLCGCEMIIGFDIAHEEAGGRKDPAKRRHERPDRFLLATRSTVSEPRTRRIPKVFVHSGVSFSKARWRMARSQHAAAWGSDPAHCTAECTAEMSQKHQPHCCLPIHA